MTALLLQVLLKDELINLLLMLRTYGGPASQGRSLAELAGALYYSMARLREIRGCNPACHRSGIRTLATAAAARGLDLPPGVHAACSAPRVHALRLALHAAPRRGMSRRSRSQRTVPRG